MSDVSCEYANSLLEQLEAANEEVKSLISHGTNLLAENERHKAQVAELTQQLQKERDRRVEHRQMNQSLNEQVQRLVTQVAELTRERDEARRKLAAHLDCSVSKLESEVTRLTEALAVAEQAYDDAFMRGAQASESRLAAANARLRDLLAHYNEDTCAAAEAHLAAQPATAPDPLTHIDRLSEIACSPAPEPSPDPCDGDVRLGTATAPARDELAELRERVAKALEYLDNVGRGSTHREQKALEALRGS